MTPLYLYGDLRNKKNCEVYQAAIDSNPRYSEEVRKYLKFLLDCLIEHQIVTQAHLREQLKKKFGMKKPNVSRYLSYLKEDLRKFNLFILHPTKSEVELHYRRRSRCLVLIRGAEAPKPTDIVERLKIINKENISGEIRITQAAVLQGEDDVFALVEGPDSDSIFEFVLGKIDGDKEICGGVRTRTIFMYVAGSWELFEPPSSDNPSEEGESTEDTPNRKVRKRLRR